MSRRLRKSKRLAADRRLWDSQKWGLMVLRPLPKGFESMRKHNISLHSLASGPKIMVIIFG